MKNLSYISAAILMLAVALSCQKATQIQQQENIFTCSVSTKSDAGADRIESYSIFIIRQRDSIVLANKTFAPQDKTTHFVDTFKNLPFENCIIAAIANGNVIEEFTDSLEILKLRKGDKVSEAMLNRVVTCNSDSIVSRATMPLTAICTQDIIQSKSCDLPLKKIIARLNVTVNNNSSNTRLVIDTIYFSKFKADRTFLFSHGGEMPASTSLTSIEGRSCTDTIAANSSSSAMSWMMFESSKAGYELNLKLTVPETGASVTINNIPLIYTSKTEVNGTVLDGIGRGDNVNVTVNVYYDTDGNVFKFGVGDWESETINQTIK